jgi:hypothetical protein
VLATVADESANGYGVLVSGTCHLEVGQVVSLKVKYVSGWVRARVINVCVVHAGCATHTRLGLARLSEAKEKVWLGFLPSRPSLSFSYTLGIAIGLGGAAIVLGLIWLTERAVPRIKVVGRELASADSMPDNANSSYRPDGRRLSGPNWPQFANPRGNSAPSVPKVDLLPAEAIIHLRPETLLKPEVAHALALNRDQCERLRSIVERRNLLAPTDLSFEVQRELRLAALRVLTEKQRRQWLRLQGLGHE